LDAEAGPGPDRHHRPRRRGVRHEGFDRPAADCRLGHADPLLARLQGPLQRQVRHRPSSTKPLVASSTGRGLYETFDFANYNIDGTIFLRAGDNQAVSAGSSGTSQLISNKTIKWSSPGLGLGNGERFTVSTA
jgi:hypothetical protein